MATDTTTLSRPLGTPEVSTPGQFSTALRYSLRNYTRNRLAAVLLVVFVPVWFLLMSVMNGHKDATFKLFSTGEVLNVDLQYVVLIMAGLNVLTIIVGFGIFSATRSSLTFDKRLVFGGYRQSTLIGAKVVSVVLIAAGIGLYTSLVLLLFWRPSLTGWLTILAAFCTVALIYGALGLFLGVLVKHDLEGFFLIIMGGLVDTFAQNPMGNPMADKPALQGFPSFGPMQFSVGGAIGDTVEWGRLAMGFGWAAAFALAGLAVFFVRTRARNRASA